MRKQVLALATLICLVSLSWCAPLPERIAKKEIVQKAAVGETVGDVLARFPSAETTMDAIDFLAKLGSYIDANRSLDLVYPEFWHAWRSDVNGTLDAWRTLLNCHAYRADDPSGCCTYFLGELREALGEENFRNGRMPPIVSPLTVKSLP